jgi:hypothetical protein
LKTTISPNFGPIKLISHLATSLVEMNQWK